MAVEDGPRLSGLRIARINACRPDGSYGVRSTSRNSCASASTHSRRPTRLGPGANSYREAARNHPVRTSGEYEGYVLGRGTLRSHAWSQIDPLWGYQIESRIHVGGPMTAPTGPISPGVKRALIWPIPKSNSSSTLRPPGPAADWIDRPSGLDDLVTTSRQLPDSWALETRVPMAPSPR